MYDRHGTSAAQDQPAGTTPSPGKKTHTERLGARDAGAAPAPDSAPRALPASAARTPGDDPFAMHLAATAERADRLHLVELALDAWRDRRLLGVDEFVTLVGMESEETDGAALPGFLRDLLLAIISKGTGALLDKLAGAVIAQLRGGPAMKPTAPPPDWVADGGVMVPAPAPAGPHADNEQMIAAVTMVTTKAKAKASAFAATVAKETGSTAAQRNDRRLLISAFRTAVKDGVAEGTDAQKVALTTFRGTAGLGDAALDAYERSVRDLAGTAISDEIERCVAQWARSLAHGAHGTEVRDGREVTKLDDVKTLWGAGDREVGVLNVVVDFAWGGGLAWRDVGTRGLNQHLLASLIMAADGRLGQVAMPRQIHAVFSDPRQRLAAIDLTVDERGDVHRITPIPRTTGTLWRPGPTPPEAGFAEHPEALWAFLKTAVIPRSYWPARMISPSQAGRR